MVEFLLDKAGALRERNLNWVRGVHGTHGSLEFHRLKHCWSYLFVITVVPHKCVTFVASFGQYRQSLGN